MTMRHRWALETLESRRLLAGDVVAQWTADDLNDSLPNGGVVESWVDSVAGHVAQARGEPQLVLSALSGRSVVRFAPSDGADWFFVDRSVNPISDIEDFSVAIVFQAASGNLHGGSGDWFDNTGLVDANRQGFGRDWGLSLNPTGQLGTGMSGGFGSRPQTIYSDVAPLNDGQTHIAIVTRAAGSLQLYVDGTLAATTDTADSEARDRLDLAFAALSTGMNAYTGTIAQIRIFDGALNRQEIVDQQAELLAYYHNEPPVAADDRYSVSEDSLLSVAETEGVLSNDLDPESDLLRAVPINLPAHGTLDLRPDGSLEYRPEPDYYGFDQFTYIASDLQPSAPATVTLEIEPAYDPPRPVSDFYQLTPEQTLVVPASLGVLANDGNPDRSSLIARLHTAGEGTIDLQPEGGFEYSPDGFAGATEFWYTIDDGTTTSDPVRISLVVNSPPRATDDSFALAEDQRLAIDANTGLLANDTDQQSDSLSVRLDTPPAHGQLSVEPDGSFVYIPAANYHGEDRFRYVVNDGFDDSAVAEVRLTIQPVNDSPVGVDDAFLSAVGQTLNVPPEDGLLFNDSDVDQQSLTASLAMPPDHGTVVVNADGSFTYTSNVGFTGLDRFTYRTSDGIEFSDASQVTVQVLAQPVMISEFMASNSSGPATRVRWPGEPFGEPQFYDWIELRNLASRPLDISGMHLTDDSDQLAKWRIPAGTVLPGEGFLLLFASGWDITDPSLDESGILHTNFRLSSSGEYLAITDADGNVIHDYSPRFPRQVADVSYGLERARERYFSVATPGASNHQGSLGIAANVQMDVARGFFEDPFLLTIGGEGDATIRYTLDGSAPTESNGVVYSGPFTIDRTTTLRARAFEQHHLPSEIETRTFLFLDDVLTQSLDGQAPSGWPDADRRINGQVFDYGLAPSIVNSPDWGPQMKAALTQIPSLSFVTDLEHLFDPETGFYVNPSRDGIEWERPASVELLHPDGTAGFQVQAGLRIRGGFSRAGGNPKHSFRLFFRSRYGDESLVYPLFGDEGVDEFQQIDLRTAQNNAWNNPTSTSTRNTLLRDIFSRDTQRDMGQPYKRGRFYHLYLNGQYWGLFQTDERSEADYATSYFGGNEDDYDVIKATGGLIDATDGSLEAWNELWRLATAGFPDVRDYYAVQGLNPDGSENPEIERHIDVDNLIDYMILIFYTGNNDAPTNGTGVNNFYAIRDRKNRDAWRFLAHDSESTMTVVGANLTRPTNVGEQPDRFNPRWLSQRLAENAEYGVRFADRVHAHFFHGALTPEHVAARIAQRAAEIDLAIIAESARWGDLTRRLYTKDDWQREVDWLVETYAPERTEVVLTQLIDQGLYPTTVAPVLNQHGGQVSAGFQLELTAPAGDIFVTLDGSDPRLPGGQINPHATRFLPNSPIEMLGDARVKARALDGDTWSALTQADFQVGQTAAPTALRVSEVHFNPAAPSEAEVGAGYTDNDEFEFIELVNTSDTPIDLSQAEFVQVVDADGNRQGVNFRFADSAVTRLPPGGRIVVVENVLAFRHRYGPQMAVAGQWQGRLSNGGEMITLQVGGQTLQQFTYDDAWFGRTDGQGYSLEIQTPGRADLDHWSERDAWLPSAQLHGTPGSPPTLLGDVNFDGLFDAADLLAVSLAAEYEDQIVGNSLFIDGDWNGDGEFDSADLVAAFKGRRPF